MLGVRRQDGQIDGPDVLLDLGVGKGLSPIWSSLTSFPPALSRRATARTTKAFSDVRERAKVVREAGMAVVIGN